MPPASVFEEHFADPPNPCREHARRHRLLDVLTIALCAVLSGAECFVDMARFGQAREGWLRDRVGLSLEGSVPSHDTFGRVFASVCVASPASTLLPSAAASWPGRRRCTRRRWGRSVN